MDTETSFNIAVGADHAGYLLKEQIKEWLLSAGYHVVDVGTNSTESVDYPDFALALCKTIEDDQCHFGVLICGSGIGVSIAANRHKTIRAALVHNTELAVLARQHNDANVICFGARFTAGYYAQQMVEAFLTARFETEGNHARRVEKLSNC